MPSSSAQTAPVTTARTVMERVRRAAGETWDRKDGGWRREALRSCFDSAPRVSYARQGRVMLLATRSPAAATSSRGAVVVYS